MRSTRLNHSTGTNGASEVAFRARAGGVGAQRAAACWGLNGYRQCNKCETVVFIPYSAHCFGGHIYHGFFMLFTHSDDMDSLSSFASTFSTAHATHPNLCLATPPFVCLGCTRPNCHMRSLQNGSTPSTPLLFQVRAAAEAAGSDMLEISPMAKGGVSKSYVQNRGRGVHQNGKSHVENDQPGRFWGS